MTKYVSAKPYYPFLVFKAKISDGDYYVGLYYDSNAFNPADIARNQTSEEWVFIKSFQNAYQAEAELQAEIEVLTYQLENGDFI